MTNAWLKTNGHIFEFFKTSPFMAIHQIAKIRINEWPVKTIFDPLTYKEHTIIQIDLGPILNLKLIPSLELTLTLV